MSRPAIPMRTPPRPGLDAAPGDPAKQCGRPGTPDTSSTSIASSPSPVRVVASTAEFDPFVSSSSSSYPSSPAGGGRPAVKAAAVVEQAYGPGACLYEDVLRVTPMALERDIRTAYFRRGRQVLSDPDDVGVGVDAGMGMGMGAASPPRDAGAGRILTHRSKLQFQAVTAAYDVLSDPVLRKEYDDTGLVPDVAVGNANLAGASILTSSTPPQGAWGGRSSGGDASVGGVPQSPQKSKGVRWSEKVEELIFRNDCSASLTSTRGWNCMAPLDGNCNHEGSDLEEEDCDGDDNDGVNDKGNSNAVANDKGNGNADVNVKGNSNANVETDDFVRREERREGAQEIMRKFLDVGVCSCVSREERLVKLDAIVAEIVGATSCKGDEANTEDGSGLDRDQDLLAAELEEENNGRVGNGQDHETGEDEDEIDFARRKLSFGDKDRPQGSPRSVQDDLGKTSAIDSNGASPNQEGGDQVEAPPDNFFLSLSSYICCWAEEMRGSVESVGTIYSQGVIEDGQLDSVLRILQSETDQYVGRRDCDSGPPVSQIGAPFDAK